jgi:hypothetical protein
LLDATHLHLVLTHAPIVGIPIGLLLVILARWRDSRDLQLAAGLLLLATALLTVPLYTTGEPAEERIESIAGAPESLVDRHEDAAATALVLTELAGLFGVGLLTALLLRRGIARRLLDAAALACVAAAVSVTWTATLGGQIRHSEIRSGATAGAAASGDETATTGSEEHEDRD